MIILLKMYGFKIEGLLFLVVLIFRRIGQKQFRSQSAADQFMTQVNEHLQGRQFDEIVSLCDSPPYWSKAVPQLVLIAMANRHWPLNKLRQLLSETFEREVLSEMDYQMSWVNTVVKTAPMLGLQGTVLGMIAAFGKIAAKQASGVNPASLASDISFALITTAVGLMIAIPLVMCMASMQVRIGRLTDNVQHQIGQFLDQLEHALAKRKSS